MIGLDCHQYDNFFFLAHTYIQWTHLHPIRRTRWHWWPRRFCWTSLILSHDFPPRIWSNDSVSWIMRILSLCSATEAYWTEFSSLSRKSHPKKSWCKRALRLNTKRHTFDYNYGYWKMWYYFDECISNTTSKNDLKEFLGSYILYAWKWIFETKIMLQIVRWKFMEFESKKKSDIANLLLRNKTFFFTFFFNHFFFHCTDEEYETHCFSLYWWGHCPLCVMSNIILICNFYMAFI